MGLKQVQIQGWLKDVNDNFSTLKAFDGSEDGLGAVREYRAQYDFSKQPGEQGEDYSFGLTFPLNAIIVGGFVEVNLPLFDNAGGGSVGIYVGTPDNIIATTAISGEPWSTQGIKAIVPKMNTPEVTAISVEGEEQARCAKIAVEDADMTGGIVTVHLYYVEGHGGLLGGGGEPG